MAWTERTSGEHWRVRYHHGRGSVASEGGFTTPAGWTGCRWGELAALRRHNTHLDDRTIVIDPDIGALKESAHRQWLGPPKTAASARTITLPAFLAVLLKHHLESHDHSPVFANADGGFLWRRSWRSRTFNPAFDGNRHLINPPVGTYPIRPGLTFHELRHSHKTWLIAARIPEIAQARRLGHRLDKRVVEVYSHVADEVEASIQKALKHAWLDARHTIADHPHRRRSPHEPAGSDDTYTYPTTAHRTPQGSSRAPPSECPNPGRRPAQMPETTTRSEIKYGAGCPRITPYSIKTTPEDDHRRSTDRTRIGR